MTMVLQPAMPAGTAIMSVLEGSTAVPPGTYRPTAPACAACILFSAKKVHAVPFRHAGCACLHSS